MSDFIQRTLDVRGEDSVVVRYFEPAGNPVAAVLMAPAMGVPQTFYAPLARWLAKQGFLVSTFDYRGIGLSRGKSLRNLDVDISDWAEIDCAVALDALAERASYLPVYWIGHSLGGQIIPFVSNRERIFKIVTIATGSGYWRENTPPRLAWLMWYFFAPLLTPVFGYFPGKRLRMVGDLPRGVIWQWRRWCLDRHYSAGAEGTESRNRYAGVTTPIVSLSFTDDEFMSARNTEALHGYYTNAPRMMTRLQPKDVGMKRIGHFGFFRPESEVPLWRDYLLPMLR